MPEILELERRRRKAGMLRKAREQRGMSVGQPELREQADGTLLFTGLACATNVEYQVGWYRENVLSEAFKRTLSEDPDVQLVVNHAAGGQLPIARTRSGTMRLSLIPEGLWVEADLDPEDPDVQSLRRKLKRKDVDGMSFAFMVHEGGDSWNEDYSVRTIHNLSLHRGDVSVVNQGANPHAYATIRSQHADALGSRTAGEVTDALREVRAGKRLSSASTEVLTSILGLTRDAETASGAAASLLDEFVNPPESDDGEATVERSITNEKGLCEAIRAVAREPGKDERRAEIIKRAIALDLPGLLPEDWTAGGVLPEGRALEGQEQRETYNDTYAALQGAVDDKFVDNGDYWYVWVRDFTDTDVIFSAGGDLWSAPYTLIPGGTVTVGEAVGVRPVTEYVPTGETEADEPKVAVDELPSGDEYLSLPDYTTRAAQELDMLRLQGGRR